MTKLALTGTPAEDLRVDAVVVGIVKGPKGIVLAPGSAGVDKAFKGKLASTLTTLGATGAAEEITKVPAVGVLAAPVIVAVGLGEAPKNRKEALGAEALRRAAGCAARALAGTARVALALPAADAAQAEAVGTGALLGAYAFDRYRTSAPGNGHKAPVREFRIVPEDAKDAKAKAFKSAVTRVGVIADAVNLARDLVNTPPSDLHPKELAEAAVQAASGLDMTVEVLDEKALQEGGYGGILGVGQGSVNPPRMARLTYTHPQAERHLALVGKGITFDSGGLSLKPSASMEWMKADMGGAAAVIAAVCAIARLGLEVNVTGWVPMAENMPSGTATRPSDVLTMYGGKTVEVLNTDAEGRLILGDAIARACEDRPDLLVDAATLTGAQMVALGSRTSAVMANDDTVRDAVHGAATRAGEQMWPMPLPEELRKSMDSEVADIANMGDRFGGMLVAGIFLKEFVAEGIKWAHLDIAGPAFNEGGPYGYTPKGGTGAAVRTFVRIAEDLAGGVL